MARVDTVNREVGCARHSVGVLNSWSRPAQERKAWAGAVKLPGSRGQTGRTAFPPSSPQLWAVCTATRLPLHRTQVLSAQQFPRRCRFPMAPKNKETAKGGKGKAKDTAAEKPDKASGKLKPATSINVRHILCEKLSKKEDALTKLRGGAKFDEVAREFSEDKARQGECC